MRLPSPLPREPSLRPIGKKPPAVPLIAEHSQTA
jgi:hypothetical protein